MIFDYEVGGGMRHFFCRALTVSSWKSFMAVAPMRPFRAGPHKGSKLDLQNKKAFGEYDPAFVAWATDALVPAAKDTGLRVTTQPIYDQQVAQLARVYLLVDQSLQRDPTWVDGELRVYRAAIKRGQTDRYDIGPAWSDVLGSAEDDHWNGHDPNHVASAVAWWLRRHHDKTAPLWRDGLTRLLKTDDASWLGAWGGQSLPPLPRRAAPESKPEYR